MNQKPMIKCDFPNLGEPRRGKVRDIYDLGDHLLMVATDRISAFDSVLPDGIPGKGEVLNRLSVLWLKKMAGFIPNHLITCNTDEYPEICRPYARQLRDRSMVVKKAKPLAVECVVRGYLAGSGWKSYQLGGTVCGIILPPGLKESEKLPEPIFTPSTKAETGHDENISYEHMARLIGEDEAAIVKIASLCLYTAAQIRAREAGIIIADTKFEFGLDENGRLILIDEVLTPDSSRFWPADRYTPGGPQPSFDKQFVRDYLESIGWNKQPPAPELPAEIIEKTSQKYLEAYERLARVLV